MAKMIASLTDGRVVPWFSEDPVPAGYVVVPPALLVKFTDGKIADGVALAKAALAGDAGADEGKPASKASAKAAKASDELFGSPRA